MDYYYALLDSYKLLKQRKLKLSVDEMSGRLYMDDAAILSYLTSNGTGGTSEAPNKVLGNIRLFIPQDDPQSVTGGLGQAAARLVDNGQLVPYESLNDTGKTIIDRIKGQEEEGQEDTPTEDPALRAELDVAAQAWGAFVKEKEGFKESMFPGLETSRGRLASSVVNLLAKGSTIMGFGGDKPEDVVEQMINTPCEDDLWDRYSPNQYGSDMSFPDGKPDLSEDECTATKVKAAKSLASLGTILKQFKDDGGKFTDEAARKFSRLSPNLLITKSGIKFGEVFIFHKTESNKKVDVLRNAVDQLNAGAEEYNDSWTGHPQGMIPLVASVPTGGGINRASRGTAAEVIVGVSVTMMNLTKGLGGAKGNKKKRDAAIEKARLEINRILKAAKKKTDGEHTLESLRIMFELGSDVDLGIKLAMGDNQSASVNYFNEIGEFFLNKGMKEADLKDLLLNAGKNIGTALVLLAYANKHFDYQLFGDLIPESVQQEGQSGSRDLGAKTDVGVNYDESECEAVTQHYGNLLSDEQKTHYELGNCSEEGEHDGEDSFQKNNGVGLEDLTQTVDKDPKDPKAGKKCYVGVEIKTLDNLKSNKGYGQSSNSRSRDLFTPGKAGCSESLDTSKENKPSKEFVALHERRMKGCGVDDKKACEFSQQVESQVADIRAYLDPDVTVAPDGTNITQTQRSQTLQQWRLNKGGPGKLSDKDKMRYAAAERYLEGKPQPPGMPDGWSDKGETDSVVDQLWQHNLGTQIKKDIGKDKKITGDAQDYLLSRLHLGAGSSEEVGKVGRMLTDDVQTFGLNNAEVMGCIGGVKKGAYDLVRSGNTYKVVYPKGHELAGKSRMEISAERGNFEIGGSGLTGNHLKESSLQLDSGDMLLEFLKGQQKLLNQLMHP